MIGVGVEVLRAFALVLLAAAGLSIFIALYNAMEERRYDLAIMRMLGASPGKLMRLVLLEAVALALVGAALGLVLGHLAAEAVGAMLAAEQQGRITGATWLGIRALARRARRRRRPRRRARPGVARLPHRYRPHPRPGLGGSHESRLRV